MTYDRFPNSQYAITAKVGESVVQQTRTKAASAVVLARSWIAEGRTGVRIVDPLGKPLHHNGYRSAIMGGGKLYR